MDRTLAASAHGSGSTPASTWSYEYGVEDATVKETDPERNVTLSTYDARFVLLSQKRKNSGDAQRTTTYTYDGPWVKTVNAVEDDWQLDTSRTYDDRGRTLSEVEHWSGGTSSYSFTTETPWAGRTTSTSRRWTSNGQTGSINGSLEADSLGNVVARTDGSLSWSWTYDAAGL